MILKSLKSLLTLKKRNTDNMVLCIISIALGFMLLKTIFRIMRNSHTVEGYEGKKELLLLHMEGCPHCEIFLPHWQAASNENKSGIKMRAVERKEPGGEDLSKKYNVSGYPTILLVGNNGNKIKSYSGNRDKVGLLNFMNNS